MLQAFANACCRRICCSIVLARRVFQNPFVTNRFICLFSKRVANNCTRLHKAVAVTLCASIPTRMGGFIWVHDFNLASSESFEPLGLWANQKLKRFHDSWIAETCLPWSCSRGGNGNYQEDFWKLRAVSSASDESSVGRLSVLVHVRSKLVVEL